MPYVIPTITRTSPAANVRLPAQSIGSLGADAELAQAPVRPDRPCDPGRHRDEEDEPPRDRREHAAEHEPDEQTADADDVVDPERQAALVRGEGVGEDRHRVRDEEGGTDPLHDPEGDEPVGPGAPVHPVDRQQQRRQRVDDEAEVVHPHAPELVAEPAETDDEHARDDEEAEDHPQEVKAVAGLERIEVDAAEDGGHRDQHDRAVDRGEQDRERRVGESDPLVFELVRAEQATCSGYLSTISACLTPPPGREGRQRAPARARPARPETAGGVLVPGRAGERPQPARPRRPADGERSGDGERVRPQSMAQMLAELETAGLIERRPDPPDRRSSQIELTAEGRDRVSGTGAARGLARRGDRRRAEPRGAADAVGRGTAAATTTQH